MTPYISCETWSTGGSAKSRTTGNAKCTQIGNIERFRVKVTCVSYQGKTWDEYGPWKKSGQTSSRKCSGATGDGAVSVYRTGAQYDPI